jgi:hypothetical protein
MRRRWNMISNIMLMIMTSLLLVICSPVIIIMEFWVIFTRIKKDK